MKKTLTKNKTTKKKEPKINMKDWLFVSTYIANDIGRGFKKFPTLTASELSMELAVEFICDHWNKKQEDQVEALDDYLCSKLVKARIKEVASQY